jgi:hypothetical protein
MRALWNTKRVSKDLGVFSTCTRAHPWWWIVATAAVVVVMVMHVQEGIAA